MFYGLDFIATVPPTVCLTAQHPDESRRRWYLVGSMPRISQGLV
jgi:hypothetical protein